MGTTPHQNDIEGDDWLSQWTIPEEDRAKYTREPWRGEARWFRSPNRYLFGNVAPPPPD